MIARIVIWLGLVATALAAMWLGGKKSAQADAKIQEADGYAETRTRMDEVVAGDDPAVLRDWLRERGQRDSNL
jgi:hypothetical protein